jgi:glyoxylase-like metal-dependent hydrolase (beta-lactamase superfamily II)
VLLEDGLLFSGDHILNDSATVIDPPYDGLALVYDDVPERMWPVAKRSLMAHVARIETMLP